MIVKLLDRLCKGVKPESYGQNYPDVPLMCMNIFVLVTDFVHHKTPKVCDKSVGTENVNDSVSLTGFRYSTVSSDIPRVLRGRKSNRM